MGGRGGGLEGKRGRGKLVVGRGRRYFSFLPIFID